MALGHSRFRLFDVHPPPAARVLSDKVNPGPISGLSWTDFVGRPLEGEFDSLTLSRLSVAQYLSNNLGSAFKPLFEELTFEPPIAHLVSDLIVGNYASLRSDLIDFELRIRSTYSELTAGHKHVFLFLSGGYDSRLELALLLQNCREKLVVLHFKNNDEEHRLVKEITSRFGLPLIVLDPDVYQKRGLDNKKLLKELLALPRWRPTVPAYFSALDEFVGVNSHPVFGYNPVSFKGRYWLGDMPGRLDWTIDSRILKVLGINELTASQAIGHEMSDFYKIIDANFGGFTRAQLQDLAYFFMVHARGYMMRIRVLKKFFNMSSPFSKIDLFREFLLLDEGLKAGNTLLERMVTRIESNLAEFPFISGTSKEIQSFDYSLDVKQFFASRFSRKFELRGQVWMRNSVAFNMLDNYLSHVKSKDLQVEWEDTIDLLSGWKITD